VSSTSSIRSRPSMSDVGRLANVSAQTVSRYFTGAGYVRTETRERIEAAIEELGYRPNLVARNLRASRTHTIGVLTMDALNHGNAMTLSGLSRAAREAEYALHINQLDISLDDPDAMAAVKRALDTFLSAQVDGIILATALHGAEALLDNVWDAVPLIAISGHPWPNVDSATVDSFRAGVLATRHLIDLGHERILHLAGPANRNEAVERRRGYLSEMEGAGMNPLDIVSAPDWSALSGYEAGLESDPAAFTAVFAANDQLALGFTRALGERGFSSPTHFSIVGVDDMPDARFFQPSLSSIWMDFESVGRRSFELLHERILAGTRPERLVIEPELRARESTAPLSDRRSHEATR
jgi:DNA-binding LacI/PurR family transcriptional regulator